MWEEFENVGLWSGFPSPLVFGRFARLISVLVILYLDLGVPIGGVGFGRDLCTLPVVKLR
jgi:hypothetical protein